MALRFGSTGFYSYYVHFANQAAGCIQQFNQNTYWGTLDCESYCRIFAARTSLSCELYGALSHPATACIVSAPLPYPRSSFSHNTTAFNSLSPAAPPPQIIPRVPRHSTHCQCSHAKKSQQERKGLSCTKPEGWFSITSTTSAAPSPPVASDTSAPSVGVPMLGVPAHITQLRPPAD
ncbi:leucine-rich repeat extensin 2 [Xyrichtys novacula]|uniref:Leucine-rich repeat extensin 2 n=1 Tax=Xyrichtys novacula TaxID=13765 RepID=A0AAV1GZ97_XYRNO|nr:leucine-rich repeat extensin 2 [Xyrichtys novacula]